MARNVMVMGCGRIGAMVAKALADAGDRVTVIDVDPEKFRWLRSTPSIQAVVADGSSMEELRSAGIEGMDLFVALSARDPVNALAAQAAKVTFGVKSVVCRMNDPTRQAIYQKLGLPTVSAAQITADLVLEAIGR